jgi:23S rRNA pseudouridine1911/1915/1917 synthase
VNAGGEDEVLTFDVPDGAGPERLDRFLAARMDGWTRSAIRKLIDGGRVTVDGDTAPKAGLAIESGAGVEVALPPDEPTTIEPESIPLIVLHEDDDLVVIDKPAGLVVHPAHGHRTGTVLHALLGRGVVLSSIGLPDRPGVVHRLDQDTSGVLAVAKTDAAHRSLAEAFAARRVRKTYHALVWGRPDPPDDEIERSVGRDPRDRKRMAAGVPGGRAARTTYRTLRSPPGFAWLEIGLETGRTHQIRVHLKSIGHPVVGDRIYAGSPWRGVQDPLRRRALREFPRQALHASVLEFAHPTTGKAMRFRSPVPADIRALLAVLEGAGP